MARTPLCDKSSGLRKGTWTPEEDRKLVAYVTRYGTWNWRQLPKFAGLARCGKSCRLRWLNYLRPELKRGNFTEHEDETIIRLHSTLGNRWSAIATELPGRTDNEIKNHWHTSLKKNAKLLRKQGKIPKIHVTPIQENEDGLIRQGSPAVLESSPLSPQPSSGSTHNWAALPTSGADDSNRSATTSGTISTTTSQGKRSSVFVEEDSSLFDLDPLADNIWELTVDDIPLMDFSASELSPQASSSDQQHLQSENGAVTSNHSEVVFHQSNWIHPSAGLLELEEAVLDQDDIWREAFAADTFYTPPNDFPEAAVLDDDICREAFAVDTFYTCPNDFPEAAVLDDDIWREAFDADTFTRSRTTVFS